MVFRGSLEKRSMLSVLGPIAQGGIDHYGQDQVPDLPIPGSPDIHRQSGVLVFEVGPFREIIGNIYENSQNNP